MTYTVEMVPLCLYIMWFCYRLTAGPCVSSVGCVFAYLYIILLITKNAPGLRAVFTTQRICFASWMTVRADLAVLDASTSVRAVLSVLGTLLSVKAELV